MLSKVLAEVKENFSSLQDRGWFLVESNGVETRHPRSEKGGDLGYREAAVLCLISYHDDKLHLLLTKRSDKISYQGDACLPGGMKDSSDKSLVDTALREAEEETHLERGQVEVVCTLPPSYGHKYGLTVVTPVVAFLKCPPEVSNLSPNPSEVECLYWVPLESFLSLQYNKKLEQGENWWQSVTFDYLDPKTGKSHHIWGLTSMTCVKISAIALNRKPNYFYIPLCVSKLVREGESISAWNIPIALTQSETVKIPLSRL